MPRRSLPLFLVIAGCLPAAETLSWPADIAALFRVPAEFAGASDGRKSPLRFADGHPAANAREWATRRAEIRAQWIALMGAWPELLAAPRLEPVGETARDGFVQRSVRLEVAAGKFQNALLLVPTAATADPAGKFPAVLVPFYDPETSAGAAPAAKPLRDFGAQLARRGFVALCIGSPGGDARKPDLGGATCQPLHYLGYIAANCHTALARLPWVDPRRIGVIGHSYGGKWAMFASCFDERFACAVWSDPGVVFDETRPSINYWEPWYLGLDPNLTRKPGLISAQSPRTGPYATMMAQGRDLHELHTLMAPRPFLVTGGAEDTPARWKSLAHAVGVNRLLGFEARVGMHNRPAHDPTAEANEAAYRFLETVLKR
ncbi:MAG: prolyl oligopeptidase family serine peptidase [Verrucomicrobia bacterium]|nr:prolyl oligopeptidase family serine peptidase [Verrucomicrobiota bacterium]